MGTEAEDFWQGYETFPLFCGVIKILRAILMGYETMFLEKILGEVDNQRLKEKLTDIWK